MPEHSANSEMAKNMVLLVFATLLSLFAAEIAYRAYLYHGIPSRFVQHDRWQAPAISFVSPAQSIFNEPYGFDYPRDQTFIVGSVQNGRLLGCSQLRTSKLGSWNVIEGNWEEAEVKVLVVGDSFTAMAHDGVSWTNLLQRVLAERTGKTVNVRNLGRDGQGVLQMLDIAAGELPRLRPDLVVIAYITDDLNRQRIWRRLEYLGGKLRYFTTTSKEFNPRLSADTQVVIPEPLSMEWCNQSPDRSDPIIRDIEERHALAIAHANSRADLFTLRHSFALNKFVYGDPFHYLGMLSTKHALTSFLDDPQASDNMRRLRESGTPIVLFHMATRTELRRNLEFVFDRGQRQLVSSLEAGLGTASILTKEHAPHWDDIEALGNTPLDDHPSLRGMDFYAQTLMNGLVRAGTLDRLLGHTRNARDEKASPQRSSVRH